MKKKAVLLVLIILCLVWVGSCVRQGENSKKPLAKNGVIDLRDWDFEKNGNIKLDGEWLFYWEQLLDPEDFGPGAIKANELIELPGRWNNYTVDGQRIPGTGFATFRLHIKVKPLDEPFALKILDMATSYRIWHNRKLVLSNGKVGTSPEESVPQYLPGVTTLPTGTRDIYLTLQVSNFSHWKGGWEPIEFGIDRIDFDIL